MTGAQPSKWQAHLLRSPCNQGYLPWLREVGSLTARIKARSTRFGVHCLHQHNAPLQHDEAAHLSLKQGMLAKVRDVLLLADGEAVVFAHTVMARHPYHSFDRSFAALGARSLGSLLFSGPGIPRQPLEFCQVDQRHFLYQQARRSIQTLPPTLWARRSLFQYGAKKLLVAELFLPPILHLSLPRPCPSQFLPFSLS